MATEIGRLVAVIDGDVTGLRRAVNDATKTLQGAGATMSQAGRALTMGLTLPIIGIGAVAAKASIDFESAFAGVRKTVDATEEQFTLLRQSIRDMAKEMPASANEIARVAQAAGALGVERENIMRFTETMIKLGEATDDLSAEQAAVTMAQFANILELTQDEIETAANALVHLGNNGASTEGQILEMSQRIAGAAKIAGLSATDVLAFANALSSIGIEADAGGSSISKVFQTLHEAVLTGNDDLETFAATAGMAVGDFAKLFREDAAEATVRFIEGLDRIQDAGGNVYEVLDLLELTDIRVARALLGAAGAGDLFRQSLKDSADAVRENNALDVEYNERLKTTASQLQLLKNQLTDVAITLGDALVPAMMEAIRAAQPLFDIIKLLAEGFANLPKPIQTSIVAFAGIVAILGPLLMIIGSMSSGVAALIKVMAFLGFITPGATISLGGLAAGFGALTLAALPWIVLGLAIGAGLYLLIKNFDAVSAAVTHTATVVKDFLIGAFNTVLGFLSGNWREVATLIAGPFAPLVALATDAFGVRSALINAFREVVSFLGTIPGQIANALGSLGNLLYNAGAALVTGLWRGMSDVAGNMIGWVVDLANKIVGVFNKVLGIFSPSKVMRKVGEQTMEGLAQGLEGGFETSVSSAIQSTASGVSDELQKYLDMYVSGVSLPALAEGDPLNIEATKKLLELDPSAYGDPSKVGSFEKTIAALAAALKLKKTAKNAPGPGMVQAEDGSWVPASFYSKSARQQVNLGGGGNKGEPTGGMVMAEDGSWVPLSFYGKAAGNLRQIIDLTGSSASEAGESLTSMAKTPLEPLKKLKSTIADVTTTVEDGSKASKSFFDRVDTTPVKKLKESIVEVTEASDDADTSITDTQDTLAQDWSAPSVEDLVSSIDKIGPAAEESIPSLEAAGLSGRNAFQEIGHAATGLGGVVGRAFKSLNNVDLGVDEWLGRAFTDAFKFLEGANLGNKLVAAFGSLNDVDLGVDEWVGRAFENATSAAGTGISNLVSFIGTNFTAENLGRATAWFLLWPVELFQQAFNAVVPVLSQFFGSTLPTFFMETLPGLATSAANLGMGIMSGMASGIRSGTLAISTFFTVELPGMISGAAVSTAGAASSLGISIGNAIGTALHSTAGTIRGFFMETLPGFISEASSFVGNAAVSLGASIISGIGRGVTEAWETIIGIPGAVATAISDGFDAYKDFWINIGKAIVSGISSGISDLAGEVAKQFGSFLGGLVNEAKKILEWRSPSKVFIEAGQSIVDGLSQGLEGMKGVDIGLSSLISDAQHTINSASLQNFSAPRLPSSLWQEMAQPVAAQPGQGLTIQAYDTVVNNYDEMQDVDKAMADFAFAAAAQLRYRGVM